MSLKDQIVLDAGIFLNTEDFAESVTYTPKGGDALVIPVLCNEGLTSLGGGSAVVEAEAMVMFARADVTEVHGGDKITDASGTVWDIDKNSLRDSDGVYWRVKVTTGGSLTFGGRS